MKDARSNALVAAIVVTAWLALPACQSDSGPQPWGDFEPSDTGAGVRDADLDGGNVDGGGDVEPDARDATDSGPDGTSQRPDVAVFPQQPTQSAQCNDDNWCWIHPSPFPYRIDALRTDGDRLLGVARSDGLQNVRLFTWDGQTMEIVEMGGVDPSFVSDVTPADGGWLSVTDEGAVYWHAPDGSSQRALTDYRIEGYDEITGNSPDEFVVSAEHGKRGLLMHQGDSTYYTDLPGTGRPRMWSNNEVWNLEEDPETVSEVPSFIEWHPLPTTNELQHAYVSALGPSPTSDCADRIVGYSRSQGFVEWPDRQTPPANITARDPIGGIGDIVCGWNDEVIAVGGDGSYMQGVSAGAQSKDVGPYGLDAAATLGETTYAGGHYGAFYGLSDGGIDAIYGGFRPSGFNNRTRFTSLWVNATETKAAVTHGGGSFGDADGWQQTPVPQREDRRSTFGLEHTDIWGVDEPEFAITPDRLYRWEPDQTDGPRWIEASIKNPGGPYEELVDIAGTSRNDVWVATTSSLFRFDGDTWREVGGVGSIADNVNGIGALLFDSDGDLLVVDSEQVYELDIPVDRANLTVRFKSPCEDPTAMSRGAGGDLLVAGRGLCVARRTNGSWSTLPLPDSVTAPQNSTIELERSWEFVKQPGTRPMMLATSLGLFELQPDGTLEREFVGNTLEAEYLPMYNAVWVLTQHGVVAKYY